MLRSSWMLSTLRSKYSLNLSFSPWGRTSCPYRAYYRIEAKTSKILLKYWRHEWFFFNIIFIPEQDTIYLVSTMSWRKHFIRYLPLIHFYWYPFCPGIPEAFKNYIVALKLKNCFSSHPKINFWCWPEFLACWKLTGASFMSVALV